MLTNMSINIFPLIMLFVIFYNDKKKKTTTRGNLLFEALILCTVGVIITSGLCVAVEGTTYIGAVWLVKILHGIFVVGVSSIWFIYVCIRLGMGEDKEKRHQIILIILEIDLAFLVFTLLTPMNKLMFDVSAEGYYLPGMFWQLPYGLGIILAAVNGIMIFYFCLVEMSKEKRREGWQIFLCVCLTFVGILCQYRWEECLSAAPSLALAILYIYLNMQNRQMTTDALTGLNNRREFNLQLTKRADGECECEWGMLMLDVDKFKKINDTLGHAVGDDALWQTADILRKTFGGKKAFLARYGGDEFAVVSAWNSDEEAKDAIAQIQDGVNVFNREKKKPYELSFSIGYAMWSEGKNVEELIARADERMYEEKMRKKELEAMEEHKGED